jgi:hypothetical protein
MPPSPPALRVQGDVAGGDDAARTLGRARKRRARGCCPMPSWTPRYLGRAAGNVLGRLALSRVFHLTYPFGAYFRLAISLALHGGDHVGDLPNKLPADVPAHGSYA